MTPEHLKIFRCVLLQTVRRNGRLGLTINEAVVQMKCAGFPSANAEIIREEIQYLQDKNFVETIPEDLSPKVESFRVSSAGRDAVASEPA